MTYKRGSHSQESEESRIPVAESSRGSSEISISETHGVRRAKCKWFNVAKGWGFLTPVDGGQDVFVHQSVIKMGGFRSLGEQEEVEFECHMTPRGLEATRVMGVGGLDCSGSNHRPKPKKRYRRVRCYNCGKFANHIATDCQLGPQPKRCHYCKSEDHILADCPKRGSHAQTHSTAGVSHTESADHPETTETN